MWEDILKKPIRNPRADRVPKNDNLSMKEYEKLFEDIADPKIKPLASIEIIASAFSMISLADIFKISSLNTNGS